MKNQRTTMTKILDALRVTLGLTFCFLVTGQSAHAATARSVILTWKDPANPQGTTYNVYRAPGPCTGTPLFAKIASAVALLTYTDQTTSADFYCYTVTAVDTYGSESVYSNTWQASILPTAPAGLTGK